MVPPRRLGTHARRPPQGGLGRAESCNAAVLNPLACRLGSVRRGAASRSDGRGDGDCFLLVPGSPCGHSGLALLRTHRALQTLKKSASYRSADRVEAELTPVGIARRKTGKARCGISFAVRREDQGELIDRVGEMHVPERAREFEGSEGGGVAEFDLIIEDQKAGQPVQGDELSRQGAVPAGRLDCPSRAVDGFRHLARREFDRQRVAPRRSQAGGYHRAPWTGTAPLRQAPPQPASPRHPCGCSGRPGAQWPAASCSHTGAGLKVLRRGIAWLRVVPVADRIPRLYQRLPQQDLLAASLSQQLDGPEIVRKAFPAAAVKISPKSEADARLDGRRSSVIDKC